MEKIAVIGCGHGGQGLAGHLAIKGHSVHLFANPNHLGGLSTVKQTGYVKCTGAVTGEGKIALCTTDIEEALQGVDIVFVALPVDAHEAMFINMLPFLNENQIVINLAGHFSGMFECQLMKKSNWEKNILVADITSFPYACRASSPGVVNIIGIKKKVGLAASTCEIAESIKTKIQSIFPSELEIKSSFIEAGLYDPAGISHPANVIFNAGRIGNREEFYFYKDGTSEETALYLDQIDLDRIEIGKRLNLTLPTYFNVMNEYYGSDHKSIFDFFKNSPIHNQEKLCPKSLQHRYLSESVPYSLVPWYTLGLSLGFTSNSMKI